MKKINFTELMSSPDSELVNIFENHTDYTTPTLLYCYAEIKRRNLVLSASLLKAIKEVTQNLNIDSLDNEVIKAVKSRGVDTYEELYHSIMNPQKKETSQIIDATDLEQPKNSTVKNYLESTIKNTSQQYTTAKDREGNTLIPVAQSNKVVNVTLTGGIIGLLAASPQNSLNSIIKEENDMGWRVIQVIPASSGNIFLFLFRLLILVGTLFIYTPVYGYYVIIERNK